MKATYPKERETDLIRNILIYLNFYRMIPAWRMNAGNIMIPTEGGGKRMYKGAPAGTSDIIGILPGSGVFLAIEAKIKGNTTTAKQDSFLEHIRSAGGVAFVAYSIDDVEKNIDEALRRIPVVNSTGPRRLDGIPSGVSLLSTLNDQNSES